MKEKLIQIKTRTGEFWKERTKFQKILMISAVVSLVIGISFISFFASNPKLVPLYSQLTPQETGQIKENLDQKGIKNEVTDNGTTVLVPEKKVNELKVQLASEGIPKSGTIDYSFFKDKSSFGMTDNEFSVLERAAMQTELENLIKNVNGVKDAKVMITLPEESVWVAEKEKTSSASVVLDVDPGYEPDQKQVMAMYTLVSKSVPNLPMDNIVITDQNFNYYDLNNTANGNGSLTKIQEQMQVKKEVERNLQTQIQQMLATMMGPDKVVVSVSADVDVKEETREESRIEPVDEENLEGIRISAEKITETYSGENVEAGGIAGTGEADVPGYPAANGAGGTGDYEKVEDRVNYDVNRIQRSIKESPYSIRDLGIQVMVEPPEADNPTSLPAQTINDIEQILSTVVRTTISKTETSPEMTAQDIQNKIYVATQQFQGKEAQPEQEATKIPWWIYVVGALLLVFIIILVILLVRKNKKKEEIEELSIFEQEQKSTEVGDIEEELTEELVQKKQLETYAKNKPEDFARLLRTWLSEE